MKRIHQVGHESRAPSGFAPVPVTKVADNDSFGARPQQTGSLQQFQAAVMGERQMTQKKIEHRLRARNSCFAKSWRDNDRVPTGEQMLERQKRLAGAFLDQEDVQCAQGHSATTFAVAVCQWEPLSPTLG